MILTADNYHSTEANQRYMSVSQFKDFLKCEARAMAKLRGEYAEPPKDCFTIGSYVAAAIEGEDALEKFKQEHPELFSSKGPTKGELKAEYKHADLMIKTLLQDDLCREMLTGQKEVIFVATMFGVEWKAKLDVYAPEEGRIVDVKTVKAINERYWKDGRPVSFVEQFDYILQMALYPEIERLAVDREESLEPLIVAISKEEEPDKAVICFDDDSLHRELIRVRNMLPRIMAVKDGFEEPVGCGNCKYCRSKKKLTGLVHYLDILEVG